jgi:hypothetical protein
MIITIIVITLIVQRPQEMAEGPLGHVSALLPRRCVREAEVNALVDSSVDHLLRHIRKAAEVARVVVGRTRVGGRYREVHFVRPEEER